METHGVSFEILTGNHPNTSQGASPCKPACRLWRFTVSNKCNNSLPAALTNKYAILQLPSLTGPSCKPAVTCAYLLLFSGRSLSTFCLH